MWRVNTVLPLGTFAVTGQTVMKKSWAFRNQGITLITTGFTGTIKFYASNTEETQTAPDLSTTADSTNSYAVVRVINLQDGNAVDGATGLPFTTDTSISRYEINDNNANWVWVGITRSAGTVEIRLSLTDNQ
jgi:hypothetical protein